MELGPTDVMERKGTLTLRSHSAHYGRPTLVNRWYYNREAEPKDYDIHQIPLGFKNLCHSTYWRLGTMDEKWLTTYQDYSSQPYRIKEYKELDMHKSLLDKDNFELAVLDRETGRPATGVGAVLPRHSPDHFKIGSLAEESHMICRMVPHPPTNKPEYPVEDIATQNLCFDCNKKWVIQPDMQKANHVACNALLDTTYRIDYVPPYDYQPYITPEADGYSVVHRKCHSQFTDTADYRRHGINTWQDESGVYANTDLKQKVFPVTNPIPTNVHENNP